jgi:hypothetical protein
MLTSLPVALVQNVLSFGNAVTISAVMCSSRELRDAVSATMALSQAIVFALLPRRPYIPASELAPASDGAPEQQYGPTLQQWLHHYPPTLTSLSLRDCHFLTDDGCKLLAARFPLLTHLDVSGCKHATSKGIRNLAKVCKSLTNFKCDNTKANNEPNDTMVNFAYIKALALSTSLTTLSLTVGWKIKKAALAPLHLLPALQELNLYLVHWNFVSLCATLTSLKTLRLCRGKFNNLSWRAFFHETLNHLTTLPRLPSLEFLHLHAAKTQIDTVPNAALPDCALTELLRPPVLFALTTSKLSSIVLSGIFSPSRQLQLQQWTALGPQNILGQLISLSIGETWWAQR